MAFPYSLMLGLTLPLAPTVAITDKDGMGGIDVGPGIVGRRPGIGRGTPGAGIQDLEDAFSMTVANGLRIGSIRVETGLTLGNAHCGARIGAKDLVNHARHRGILRDSGYCMGWNPGCLRGNGCSMG